MSGPDIWHVVSWLFTGLMGLVIYFIRTSMEQIRSDLHDKDAKIRELEKDITEVKIRYVHKDDLKDFKDELFVRLDRIEHKLNA